jgi:intracellular septation protein
MSEPSTETRAAKPQLHPGVKLALDLGPLLVFFLANTKPALFEPLLRPFLSPELLSGPHAGIYTATAVFMPTVLIALAIGYAMTRHLPIMPVVTAVIVVVFGGATLILQDEQFIKLKPTIVYLLFAAVLLGGLAFGKPLLGMVFDAVFNLTNEGWRKLTVRWALFFVVMAVLNEIVARTQSDNFWVAFKVFGALPLTFVFAMLQYPLLAKYAVPAPEEAKDQ